MYRWSHVLCNYSATRLIPEQSPTDVGWVGDASESFGIGIIISGKWAQFRLKEGWQNAFHHVKNIAWLETVAVRLGLLMLIELDVRPGRLFYVNTDNTTTEAVITKRRSNDRAVNSEWRSIQDVLILNEVDLQARCVCSAENRADGLSRGVTTGFRERDQFVLSWLPLDLQDALEQVESL
jgi:hypothetical protein